MFSISKYRNSNIIGVETNKSASTMAITVIYKPTPFKTEQFIRLLNDLLQVHVGKNCDTQA